MAKITLVAGGRSDYGLLEPLLEWLQDHNCGGGDTNTLIQLFGASTASGWPSRCFRGASLRVVECFTDSDSPEGVCASMGLVCMKLPQILKEGAYEKVIVLGDRYEILSVACCAYTLGIPISHIEGSDTTLGSLDNGYRAAIRSLAAEHYDVEEYGSLGCVFPPDGNGQHYPALVVLIYHSHKGDWESELRAILDAVKPYRTAAFGSNKDADGRKINRILKENGIIPLDNLPRMQYINILRDADFIIGNSSSGIIESASLHIPAINVGDRQKGRMRAKSVIQADGSVESIKQAIEKIKDLQDFDFENPYFRPNIVERIGKGILGYA